MIIRYLFIIVLFSNISIACKKKSGSSKEKREFKVYKVNRERIKKRVDFFSSTKMKGRKAYTIESRKAADYVAAGYKRAGLIPLDGKYLHEFKRKDGKVDQNVIGVVKGSSNKKVIIVGAHYDHLGVINGEIYPGADDNASGTAVLMELALILGRKSFKHSIWFVGFGAEEVGLHGSKALVSSKLFLKSKVKLMINMDMLGRALYESSFGKTMIFTVGVITHKIGENLSSSIYSEAKKAKMDVMILPDKFLKKFGDGFFYDTIPFNKLGISTLFFSTSLHKDYHKPTDTIEKINFVKMERTTNMLKVLIEKIANDTSELSISNANSKGVQ